MAYGFVSQLSACPGPHPTAPSGALIRGLSFAAGSENEKRPPPGCLERSRKGWRGYANEGVRDGTVVRSASLLGPARTEGPAVRTRCPCLGVSG
ncbi:Hypothetical predicted protein [Marmota monax]|uniref:Uncharacterized protein n=1 Tax=Marmota monax TaxID=9995 RepID=A0A5E4AL24_MARMO|nr:Hypothetical predicted protein [Marmota monax]